MVNCNNQTIVQLEHGNSHSTDTIRGQLAPDQLPSSIVCCTIDTRSELSHWDEVSVWRGSGWGRRPHSEVISDRFGDKCDAHCQSAARTNELTYITAL